MVVNFSNVDMKDRPTLILKNAGGTPLGVLGYATNVTLDAKYNEVSTLEFELPAYVDGIEVPYYDDVIGMRIIELRNVGQFTLVNPVETGDGVKRVKTCKANSLEYEFVYKKISIPNGTYKFYGGTNREDTILGMILELMPSWHVGSISTSLWNKYRTFDETNENVYNFIKGSVQESFNCIFDFDTTQRLINIRDVSENAVSKPVFISNKNLAKQIELTENTEDIVTRLDVNGAEGVDIRDVNPTGTNKIIMLDYFMNEKNFSSALITKYNTWKNLVDNNRTAFYNLNIQHTLATMEKIAEEAKLADLQGELTSLENVLAVAIQAVARKLQTQSAIDQANANIRAKEAEIAAQKSKISTIETQITSYYNQLKAITNTCSFEKYFTSAELLQLDRYIKDDEISESSFVATTTATYSDPGVGQDLSGASFSLSDATITNVAGASTNIYDCKGGTIEIGGLSAECISCVVERKQNSGVTITAFLGKGTLNTHAFNTGCVSISGTFSAFSASDTDISAIISGYMYFTMDASEYEKRSISWELYEYGLEVMRGLAYPTYSFSVDSANFFALDEFESFKNHIELGQKVYLEMNDDRVIEPICIGVKFNYGDLLSLELQFSDSYVSGDSEFRLVDLLEKSVSMGKNVEVSRYIYSSFVDSGASNSIKDFMTSALDTAKNAILSSTDQAITWDGAGFRLRKYSNEAHTAYDPEQIWMNNNSIVMTDDSWATAKMAIGKFHDDNLGDCWGIVAPMIVGTILAGERLMIESSKKDGGVSVFTVDEDGCRLYNSDFEVARTVGTKKTSIVLNPDIGIAIGSYPLYDTDATTGKKTLRTANAKFYADDDGNLHLTGQLTATSLIIRKNGTDSSIDDYISGNTTHTYSQDEAPTDANIGDLWVDTNDSNKMYRYNGTTWDLISSNDGPKVFIQNTMPSNYKRGDIWQDPSNNFRQYTAVSNTWGNMYDWALTSVGKVAGASLVIDPDTGSVEILASKTMTIGSTGTLALAANSHLTIGSNAQITMASGGNITISAGGYIWVTTQDANGNGGVVCINRYGVTLSGTSINMGATANINMQGGTIQLQGGSISLISNAGLTISGGAVTISSGSTFALQSGGVFSVDADDDNSYIRFGGTSTNPNFMVGRGGEIRCKSITADNLYVNGSNIITTVGSSLATKIIVSDTKPSGHGILWAKPGGSSGGDSGAVNFLAQFYDNMGPEDATCVQTLYRQEASAVGGTSCSYGVKFGIYIYGSSSARVYLNHINVKIRGSSQTETDNITIFDQYYSSYYLGTGSYIRVDTLNAPQYANLPNLSSYSGITVTIRVQKTGYINARFEVGEDHIVRCYGTAGGGGTGDESVCEMLYIP